MWRITLLFGVLSLAGPAVAQLFPAKPVRIVVTFTPGGAADILARTVGEKLTQSWGQQVIVENRPGASGIVGTEAVVRSAPDGYTLLLGYNSEIAVNPHLFRKLAYDPFKDLAPVSMVGITPMILVVTPTLPAKSLKELIALAKQRPRELVYASVGVASLANLAMQNFMRLNGIELVHVPYKGAAPALFDVIGGHAFMFFSGMPPAMPHVRAGKVRALAVSTQKRSPAAPEVPTVAESGYPGFDFANWFALFAPAGTPGDVIAGINTAVARALALPDVVERLKREGAEPSPNSPQQLARFVQKESAKYREIIQKTNIRVE